MKELKSVKTYSDLRAFHLSDKTKFRLNEINKIKDYFEPEIKVRKVIIKKLSKYIAGFNYTDKILIVLSATSGGISIIPQVNIVGVHAGIISSTFILIFSLATGIIRKLLNETKKKKKKHSKIIMLTKNKLNSIETLISQAILDLEINHEGFIMIADEKKDYNDQKESIKNKGIRMN